MTQLKQNKIYNETDFNLLVGGTPCQSFSVAGLRKGLSDERGNLSLEFVRILIDKQPDWFLWENVPGVLSSGKGADFASILSAFTGRSVEPQKFGKSGIIEGDPDSENGAGYSIAYRILDSRYFGVPQRRRRVFVIGHLGNDWRPPVAVLFERDSLRRDFTPSRKARETTAGFTPSSFGNYSEGVGTLKTPGGDLGGGNAVEPMHNVAPCQTKTDVHAVAYSCATKQQSMSCEYEMTGTIGASEYKEPMAVFFDMKQHHNPQETQTFSLTTGNCNTVRGDTPLVMSPTVRRLTPTECERLQGFPDDYTNIPGAKDSNRYKACGNSMTRNVMQWLGERIDKVDKLIKELKACAPPVIEVVAPIYDDSYKSYLDPNRNR